MIVVTVAIQRNHVFGLEHLHEHALVVEVHPHGQHAQRERVHRLHLKAMLQSLLEVHVHQRIRVPLKHNETY